MSSSISSIFLIASAISIISFTLFTIISCRAFKHSFDRSNSVSKSFALIATFTIVILSHTTNAFLPILSTLTFGASVMFTIFTSGRAPSSIRISSKDPMSIITIALVCVNELPGIAM